jgi:hypothetical protein
MKFNLAKAATYTGTTIDGVNYRYGWYESGRAFIAKEDELMTYKEAYKTFVPKSSFNMHDYFFDGRRTLYKKTIDGIVRYLINKYNS